MSLWVDKHRPCSLDKLSYHDNVTSKLKHLASAGDFPHLLFYGPSGAGKKTRIMCMLKELYGPGVERLKIEHKTFQSPSGKKVEISTIASNYHIEVNPSDVGRDDYTVVRNLLKEVAQTQNLDAGSQKAFKVVVISEADKISKEAQHALRRIMEKYMKNCRYILCTNNLSKVIAPIRSRCLGLRIGAPSDSDIISTLELVAKKESVTLPQSLSEKIAANSKGNLRRAILMFEACRVQSGGQLLSEKAEVQLCDWEVYIEATADMILKEQSPQRLLQVRNRLYELITHCIPPEVIIKQLTFSLMKGLDASQKITITQHAAEYEHRMQLGSKAIFHLEAFVAKFMSVYKQFLEGFDGFLGDD